MESLWIPKGFDFEDDRVNHSKVFKRMKSLQVLILGETVWSDFLFLVMAETICSRSIITCLPSSLRWIEWPNYPSRLLPERFEPSHLVGLCLKGSRLVELWPISKVYLYTLSLSPIQQNSIFLFARFNAHKLITPRFKCKCDKCFDIHN